ncbi:hypothetical protein RRG08_060191 [Elysia crispata]|uniref:Uncharacterized protein n=1 Tax=Elysia crispata TaxID=231223 RepID=A0AAE0ZZ74_9GAST|nr:hypothetical protein RRG08_060191 [Elysia crispata]
MSRASYKKGNAKSIRPKDQDRPSDTSYHNETIRHRDQDRPSDTKIRTRSSDSNYHDETIRHKDQDDTIRHKGP